MRRRPFISPRPSALVLAALLVFAAPRLPAAETAPPGFFAVLDEAPLVVTATVVEHSENPAFGIVVYELSVQQVLKGAEPPSNPVVVQDLLFPSDRPVLGAGREWLVALEPLPSSSRYRGLPADETHLRIRDGRHGVRPAEATAAVLPYLGAAAEPAEKRRRERIAALIAALPSPVVGGDAVTGLGAEPSLARNLSEDQSVLLAAALSDPATPLEERRALLDLIREKRLTALLPAVRALLADPSLAPFARRVLASFGEVPSTDELRADLERLDPAARRAALEASESLPPAERVLFLTEIANNGREHEVRAAAIDDLARIGHPAVPALAALLHDPDGRISYKAAKALASGGGTEAVAALSAAFDGGSYDTQVAAVFALRDIGSKDAMRILRQVRAAPPDPRLEKVIDVALGVDKHGH
jgi:HEAT repeat protein